MDIRKFMSQNRAKSAASASSSRSPEDTGISFQKVGELLSSKLIRKLYDLLLCVTIAFSDVFKHPNHYMQWLSMMISSPFNALISIWDLYEASVTYQFIGFHFKLL